MIFSHKLKKLLSDKNIKQVELAEALGKSKWVVNNWIRGISNPTPMDLDAVANYFSIKVTDLYDSSADFKTERDNLMDLATNYYFDDTRSDQQIDAMFRSLNEIYIQSKNHRSKKIKRP